MKNLYLANFVLIYPAPSFCTFDHVNKGCYRYFKYEYEVPFYFAYFDNDYVDGDLYANFCPIVETTQSCRVPGCIDKNLWEEFCDECRCVKELMDFQVNIMRYMQHVIISNAVIVKVAIHVGDHQITCITTGEMISVTGYYGQLKCPDTDIICADSSC